MVVSRSRVLLSLLVVLSAVMLTVGGRTTDRTQERANRPPASAVAHQAPSGLDPALVRLRFDDGRESGGTQRVPKGGLVLIVLLTVLAARGDAQRQRLVAVVSTMTSRLAGWSPSSGRAPPFRQLPVS